MFDGLRIALCAVLAVGLVGACGGSPGHRISYDAAPCPQPNFPGVPVADLGARPHRVSGRGPGGAGTLSVPGVVAGGSSPASPTAPTWLLRDHPQGIRSMVLDSVVPASLNIVDGLALGAYCQEMANWTTPDRALSQAKSAMPGLAESVLRITSTGSWIFRECDAWGLGRSDAASRLPALSTVPTLILSGTFDSSTAPQWINEITLGLSNSVVLHFPGIDHAVLPTSVCAQAIMTTILAATSISPASPRPPFRHSLCRSEPLDSKLGAQSFHETDQPYVMRPGPVDPPAP